MKLLRIFLSFALLATSPLFAMHLPYLVESVKANEPKVATEELINIFNNLGRVTLLPTKNKLEDLIDRGANINATGREGKSLLQLAVIEDYNEGVEILLAHGANPNQLVTDINGYKQPLLVQAILYGAENPHVIESLLKAGANPNAKDNIGHPALHVAVMRGNTQKIQLLLKYGADIESRNTLGHTALTTALLAPTAGNKTKVIEMLLKSGANPNEQSPLISALSGSIESTNIRPAIRTNSIHEKNKRILLLLQAGADPKLKFKNESPLEYAERKLLNAPEEDKEQWQTIIGWLENPAKAPRIAPKEKLTIKPATQKKLEDYLINQETENLKASEEFKKSAQEAAEKHLEQLKKDK